MADPFILHYTPYMREHTDNPSPPSVITISAEDAKAAKAEFMSGPIATALLLVWDDILVWSIQRQAESAKLRAWNEPYWRDGGFAPRPYA